jgi:hypothetical protein
MRTKDWGMEIVRVSNGYYVRLADMDTEAGITDMTIEDAENDVLKSGEELLWTVLDHFALSGSKHDKERLRIIREPGSGFISSKEN